MFAWWRGAILDSWDVCREFLSLQTSNRHNGVVGFSGRQVSIRELLRLTRNLSWYGSVFTCKLLRPLNQPCESPFCSNACISFCRKKNGFLFVFEILGRKKNWLQGVSWRSGMHAEFGSISLGLHFRLHQHISLSIRFTTFLDAIPCPERKVRPLCTSCLWCRSPRLDSEFGCWVLSVPTFTLVLYKKGVAFRFVVLLVPAIAGLLANSTFQNGFWYSLVQSDEWFFWLFHIPFLPRSKLGHMVRSGSAQSGPVSYSLLDRGWL